MLFNNLDLTGGKNHTFLVLHHKMIVLILNIWKYNYDLSNDNSMLKISNWKFP